MGKDLESVDQESVDLKSVDLKILENWNSESGSQLLRIEYSSTLISHRVTNVQQL
jgi:hypothetical protein